MKILLPALLVFGLAATFANGGVIVTGTSIDFDQADFSGGSTASKNIIINSADSPLDTNVWSYANMTLGGDGRLGTLYGDQPVDYSVTYKITSPSDLYISEFTFALNNLTIAGGIGGGNVINYQYSIDGSTFFNFATYQNRDSGATGGWEEILNQTYSVTLSTASNQLFIRIYEQGNGTSSNYYAIWSNSGGGSNPNSYVAVTVVPEPGSVALLGIGIGGIALIARMKRRRAGDGRS